MTPTILSRAVLKKALDNPSLVAAEVERISKRPLHIPQRLLFSWRYDDGFDVMSEDWDTLVLLDACRYDILSQHNPFETTVESRISNASQSAEFCEANFAGETFHDTVYVTANPYGAQVDPEIFHDMFVTFGNTTAESEERAIVDDPRRSWDPQLVTETALEAHERHPDKRLLVHYMQPHAPYYGRKAAVLRDELAEQGLQFWAWDDDIDRETLNANQDVVSHLLSAAQNGYLDPDTLKAVYVENLEIVLRHVQRLLAELDGKTVITSDHGEMLGERKRSLPRHNGHLTNYIGHERRVYTKELREVPWLVLDSERRREIRAEPPVRTNDFESAVDESQLKALGYVD